MAEPLTRPTTNYPVSAPNTPAVLRKGSGGAPVTPLRPARHDTAVPAVPATTIGQRNAHMRGQSTRRSPLTPASAGSGSPFGGTPPLSERSFADTSGDASTLLSTPSVLGSSAREAPGSEVRIANAGSVVSPLAERRTRRVASGADEDDNWRIRASAHGIKVATAEDSQFDDDEGELL
jgi:hypothetical protein